MNNVSTISYGKWILAGEHSVLRGCEALVFPSYQHSMVFEWQKTNKPLKVEFKGTSGEEVKLAFWGVLESALERLGKSRNELIGQLQVTNNIPLGGGLGASAALCVGIAKLGLNLGWVEEKNLFEFSRGLEDLFHGESSGVDVAASIRGEGMSFKRAGEMQPITMNWKPTWYLSYSGTKGVTSYCVNRVKELFLTNPDLAEKIDLRMAESVELSKQALAMTSAAEGLPLLAKAIDNACQCFTQWKLVGNELGRHLQELLKSGAIAVKPTGSGGGGYVLSLWKTEPPEAIKSQLIPLSKN